MNLQVGDRVTFRYLKIKDKIYITIINILSELTDYERMVKENQIEILKVEEKKELLNEKEREYLSNIIRPFKNIVRGIEKREWGKREYIHFYIIDEVGVSFPYFEPNTMYKGMKLKKEYTLSELGLEEK